MSQLLEVWQHAPLGAGTSVKGLAAAAGLSVSEEHGTEELIKILTEHGLLEFREGRWYQTEELQRAAAELSIACAAVDLYRHTIHQDATEAQVVVTRPLQASALAKGLLEAGHRLAATEETAVAFDALVRRATQRLIVMTPFLDHRGAAWLRDLLGAVPEGVDIYLILRGLEDATEWDYPRGYPAIAGWLTERGVNVLNYSLSSLDVAGRETFHAKVILADRTYAYIGSANVTASSRDNSMELGVVVQGRAAIEIASIVEPILSIAEPYPNRASEDLFPCAR